MFGRKGNLGGPFTTLSNSLEKQCLLANVFDECRSLQTPSYSLNENVCLNKQRHHERHFQAMLRLCANLQIGPPLFTHKGPTKLSSSLLLPNS
jgi:hypothetical protein